MKTEQIFLLVWLIIVIGLFAFFTIKGRKSLKKFPNIEKSNFEYTEYSLSEYSTDSFITEMGGAKNALRVKVTKDELWITTNVFMAWIAEQFDLLHIIPFKSLKSIKNDGKYINIEFEKNGV